MSKLPPSSHVLDLEYSGTSKAANNTERKVLVLRCKWCSNINHVSFFTTLSAWRTVIEKIVAMHAGITKTDLLQQAKRPSAQAQAARDLLAVVVAELAESRSEATEWLKIVGFKPRWIRTTLSEAGARVASDDVEDVLSSLQRVLGGNR